MASDITIVTDVDPPALHPIERNSLPFGDIHQAPRLHTEHDR